MAGVRPFRFGWIRDEAGDRVERLDLGVLRLIGDPLVTREPLKAAAEVARQLSDWTGVEIRPQDVLESPYSLIGTVPDWSTSSSESGSAGASTRS